LLIHWLIINIKKLIQTHAIEFIILLKMKIDNYFKSNICYTIFNHLLLISWQNKINFNKILSWLIFLKQVISGPHSAMDIHFIQKWTLITTSSKLITMIKLKTLYHIDLLFEKQGVLLIMVKNWCIILMTK